MVEAPAAMWPVFDRLLQLYKYDFSEFAPIGSPHGEVDAEGRFTYPSLEGYWRESGRIPLRIRADDHIAGFALVNRWSPARFAARPRGRRVLCAVQVSPSSRRHARGLVHLSPIPRPMGAAGGLVQPACPGVLAQCQRGGSGREGGGGCRRRGTLEWPCAALRHRDPSVSGTAEVRDELCTPRLSRDFRDSGIFRQLSRIRWGGHHFRSKCPYGTPRTSILSRKGTPPLGVSRRYRPLLAEAREQARRRPR